MYVQSIPVFCLNLLCEAFILFFWHKRNGADIPPQYSIIPPLFVHTGPTVPGIVCWVVKKVLFLLHILIEKLVRPNLFQGWTRYV